MAYYDKLVAAWNSATLPAGVTGTALTAGMTTAQKMAAVNGWTQVGPAIPMLIPTYQIYNLIVGSEFAALTAANQQLVRDILNMGTVDASPGTQIRARVVAIFPSATATFANLNALAAKYDTAQISWWQANGYKRQISKGDVVVAGLDSATGYSVTFAAPQTRQFNVTLSVVVTGPKTTETVSTLAVTLDADYAAYFAANCVDNMMTRDAALATF